MPLNADQVYQAIKSYLNRRRYVLAGRRTIPVNGSGADLKKFLEWRDGWDRVGHVRLEELKDEKDREAVRR